MENQIIEHYASQIVDASYRVHTAQLISYLKLADKKVGFLINFPDFDTIIF